MTVRYNTILVAVDGSNEAERAFRKAVLLAKDHEAKLLLVRVVDTRTTAAVGRYRQTDFPEVEEYAKSMLKEYKKLAEKEGVKDVSEILEYGSPRVKIADDVTRKHNVDLIVAGATGLNAVERFVMGSVSQHIARHAACDVLIVRTETENK